MKHTILLTAITLYAVLSCNKIQPAEAEQSIDSITLFQTHQAWSAAVKSGDAPKIFSYWDEDAVDYFPSKPAAHGIKAIKRLINANRSISGFTIASEVEEAHVSESGEMGYTHGRFEMTTNDEAGNPVTRPGHFICVWQNTSGVWKCVRSMATLENQMQSQIKSMTKDN